MRILITGPPKSGKTTFARSLLAIDDTLDIVEAATATGEFDLRVRVDATLLTTVQRMFACGMTIDEFMRSYADIECAYERAASQHADIIVCNCEQGVAVIANWLKYGKQS